MGKRVWELVYRNAYVLEGVGYDGESEHRWGLAQVAKLLHLTFQHSIAIQWWVAGLMEKSKPQLAFAGSCKLQCYVSSHPTTCSAAQSLLISCPQHFVEESRYISMCCGSRNCLWGRAVGLETWKMLCTNNWSFLTGKAVQFWTPKGLEKTEFVQTVTSPEAKWLSRWQGSSEGIYRVNKSNKWRNSVIRRGMEKAQGLEEGK